MTRETIAVDFDGVIYPNTGPWRGIDHTPEEPVSGAIRWLNLISQQFRVVIFTNRAVAPQGVDAVARYLREHGYSQPVTITAMKPSASVYIDDRGWRFEGRFPSIQELATFRPWNRGPHHGS